MKKPVLDSTDLTIVSTMAGIICNFMTSPFWIIQTRMCVSKVKKGIFGHCKDIYKEGGLLAFWKGCIPGLILVINPVINFVCYEKIRTYFVESTNQTPTAFQIFLISLVGKFLATIVTYPILTIKTKAFTNTGDESTWEIIKNYLKNEGFMASYRGLYAKIIQTLLANAFMMVAFEKIREFVSSKIV